MKDKEAWVLEVIGALTQDGRKNLVQLPVQGRNAPLYLTTNSSTPRNNVGSVCLLSRNHAR